MNPILMTGLAKMAAVAALLGCAWILPARAANEVKSSDDQFLDRLVGTWDMDGGIGHQPVHYLAVGERTLARGWIEFHSAQHATR